VSTVSVGVGNDSMIRPVSASVGQCRYPVVLVNVDSVGQCRPCLSVSRCRQCRLVSAVSVNVGRCSVSVGAGTVRCCRQCRSVSVVMQSELALFMSGEVLSWRGAMHSLLALFVGISGNDEIQLKDTELGQQASSHDKSSCAGCPVSHSFSVEPPMRRD
jgi:hypothetical protein